jgi:hypothetical protein
MKQSHSAGQGVDHSAVCLLISLIASDSGHRALIPPGPPMTLGNMRELGVRHLIAICRHQALVDVSKYPDDVEVPWFGSRGKCGRRGRWVDVRPNWKEQPPGESLTGKQRR